MLTAAGRKAANMPSRPATTKDLQERIFNLLGKGERKMLTLLIGKFRRASPASNWRGRLGIAMRSQAASRLLCPGWWSLGLWNRSGLESYGVARCSF